MSIRMRPTVLSLLATLVALAWVHPLVGHGQTDPASQGGASPAMVTLQPPADAPRPGDSFTTDLAIDGAEGLLGYQVEVGFDPAMVSLESMAMGPFLSSTGRSAQPLGPDLAEASQGRVVFGGFTLGQPEQPGATGAGVLATLTWQALVAGQTQLDLEALQLAGRSGALPGETGAGLTVTVNSPTGFRGEGIVLLAALIALATAGLVGRRRA